LALRSACLDDRLAACVSWGGFVDMETSDVETLTLRDVWRHVSRAVSEEVAREIARTALDVRSVLGRLHCPTYVLHGALGDVPLRQVQLLRELATNTELTVVVEPAGDHCCDNLGPVPRVAMADWLMDRLA
jgi:2,6-dihydroxypseudooxynicotine hydrolase